MITAVNKARIEINDQPDEFIESVDCGTADPRNVAGITEIEHMRHSLIECQLGIPISAPVCKTIWTALTIRSSTSQQDISLEAVQLKVEI